MSANAQKKGTLLPPSFQKKEYTQEYTKKHGHTIGEAIANYREHRDLLELFDPLTCSRQDNSLNKWDGKFCKSSLGSLAWIFAQRDRLTMGACAAENRGSGESDSQLVIVPPRDRGFLLAYACGDQ